jgi:putative transposase
VRWVYNYFLSLRRSIYLELKQAYGYKLCSSKLTLLKKEFPWLREPDSIPLQATLEHLQSGYDYYFMARKRGDKNWGLPVLKKKKDSYRSYETKNLGGTIQVLAKHIKLPKLGLVPCRVSKRVEGRILNATVIQVPSGKFYVSICCTEVEIPQYPSTGKAVGIDLGLETLATPSDGDPYENHKRLKDAAKKLAREQRRLSRKTIGGSNYEKQRVKVAKVHEDIANRRNDSIHKMTTELVSKYDIIVMEDLAVMNMMKNHRLAGAISDASWGEVKRQLEYKCKWQHKAFVQVGRFYPSSQLCQCGYKNPEVKDLKVRYWVCPECGAGNDRDGNAASNILREGLRLLETDQVS